jgi:dolichol-phosphate mannosyltransferase
MDNNFKLSIVVPLCNEEGNIFQLYERISNILRNYNNHELIFIDDGSTDHTLHSIKELSVSDSQLKYLAFSRNFGHQNALRAGFAYATGDCVISMDGDLQHPPELIPKMIEKWKEGYKIVYTIRKDSKRISFFKRKTASIFYALMSKFSDVRIPQGAADFRLLDRSIVEIIVQMNENSLFLRGLISWIGFDQFSIEYDAEERFSGRTKYSFWYKMFLILNKNSCENLL